MQDILIYRFSAIGDVIMLLPAVKAALAANPDIRIHLVSRPFFAPVFKDIDRLEFIGVDLKNYNGITGLYRLYKTLKADVKPQVVLDMHQVLRTHMLNFFFRSCGKTRIYKIDKGRDAKKEMVRTKVLKDIPTTVDRYCNVFKEAGFAIDLQSPPLLPKLDATDIFQKFLPNSSDDTKYIGIAPFSAHLQKEWGVENFKQLITELEKNPKFHIVLFGAGKKETDLLEQIAEGRKQTTIANRHIRFADEIRLMPNLSMMISMDSANMHLAAMAGIPVLSIWGATHPALGFSPYMQSPELMVQYTGTEISCRPCSVYGNKACQYGDDIKCMNLITPAQVLAKVNDILS